MKTIEELAREAGLADMLGEGGNYLPLVEVASFAALVAEQCAQVIERSYSEPAHEPDEEGALVLAGEHAAMADNAEMIRRAFPMPKG